MIHVVIVNGFPRAGKDTFVELVTEVLRYIGVPADSFSSIDPVRDMLTGVGFDLSGKTPADRKLLAVVGSAVEEHSRWRTTRCLEAIQHFKFAYVKDKGVFFLHVREPENIGAIWARLPRDMQMVTVLIESDRSEKTSSNAADAGVYDIAYSHTIQNNGTLEDLAITAQAFVKEGLGL